MLKSEFIERTHYEPNAEEYYYIEESYYEFDGNKDEFCKEWLKARKSGKWQIEYKYRKMLDEQKAEYEEQLKKKEESLKYFIEYTQDLRERAKTAENKLRGIKNILG